MKLSDVQLPEPVIVDGRMLFTKASLKEYGKACYNANEPEPYVKPDEATKATKDFMSSFGDILARIHERI